jgi:hypothetical protein
MALKASKNRPRQLDTSGKLAIDATGVDVMPNLCLPQTCSNDSRSRVSHSAYDIATRGTGPWRRDDGRNWRSGCGLARPRRRRDTLGRRRRRRPHDHFGNWNRAGWLGRRASLGPRRSRRGLGSVWLWRIRRFRRRCWRLLSSPEHWDEHHREDSGKGPEASPNKHGTLRNGGTCCTH